MVARFQVLADGRLTVRAGSFDDQVANVVQPYLGYVDGCIVFPFATRTGGGMHFPDKPLFEALAQYKPHIIE